MAYSEIVPTSDKINNAQTITSMEVAEMVGKDHNKLLRDIREYITQLDTSKIGHTDFSQNQSMWTRQTERNLVMTLRRKVVSLSPTN